MDNKKLWEDMNEAVTGNENILLLMETAQSIVSELEANGSKYAVAQRNRAYAVLGAAVKCAEAQTQFLEGITLSVNGCKAVATARDMVQGAAGQSEKKERFAERLTA
jgi:hypothetical protein